MVTQVGFTGGRLDTQLWCNQEIVRTVHTALRRGLLVLLNGHDDSKYVSSKILTHSTGKTCESSIPAAKLYRTLTACTTFTTHCHTRLPHAFDTFFTTTYSDFKPLRASKGDFFSLLAASSSADSGQTSCFGVFGKASSASSSTRSMTSMTRLPTITSIVSSSIISSISSACSSSLPSNNAVEASIWYAYGVRQRWHTSWTVPDTDRVNSGNPILPVPPTTCQVSVPELSAQSFVNRVISATGVTPSRLPLMRLNSKASITKAFIGRNFPRKTCDNNRVFRAASKT